MSKRARTLILGVALAAMNLVGMTAVAQAHPSNDPTSERHRALGQVEVLATADHAVAAQQQPTDSVELFRHGERASQEQTAADATVRGLLARERSSIPSGTPAQVPVPVRPPEPSGQPDWLVPAIGVLAAVLALGGWAGRAGRQARRPQGSGRAGRLTARKHTHPMGLPRPPGSPIALPTTGLVA